MLEQLFNDDAILSLMPSPDKFFADSPDYKRPDLHPLERLINRADLGEYGLHLAWLETPGQWGKTYGFRLDRKIGGRDFRLVVQQDEYSEWCAYIEVDIAVAKGRSRMTARAELCRCMKRGSNDPGQRKGLRRDWFKALSHEVNSMIEKDQLEPQWD